MSSIESTTTTTTQAIETTMPVEIETTEAAITTTLEVTESVAPETVENNENVVEQKDEKKAKKEKVVKEKKEKVVKEKKEKVPKEKKEKKEKKKAVEDKRDMASDTEMCEPEKLEGGAIEPVEEDENEEVDVITTEGEVEDGDVQEKEKAINITSFNNMRKYVGIARSSDNVPVIMQKILQDEITDIISKARDIAIMSSRTTIMQQDIVEALRVVGRPVYTTKISHKDVKRIRYADGKFSKGDIFLSQTTFKTMVRNSIADMENNLRVSSKASCLLQICLERYLMSIQKGAYILTTELRKALTLTLLDINTYMKIKSFTQ